MATFQASVDSPLGPLQLTFEGDWLVELHFGRAGRATPASSSNGRVRDVAAKLSAYLRGERRSLPVRFRPQAGTDFQRRVWKATQAIPYGQVRSYGWIAERIGSPGAARAVGQALGHNPLPLLVPCHRVVAAGGTLGGFTGGLDLKRKLLRLEGSLDDHGALR